MSIEEASKAIQAAYDYLLKTLMASGVAKEKVANARIEEAVKQPDGNFKITLSYDIIGDFAFDRQRELKDFIVDSNNMILSMTMRKL